VSTELDFHKVSQDTAVRTAESRHARAQLETERCRVALLAAERTEARALTALRGERVAAAARLAKKAG
jgi:hypothetical protein